MIPRRKTIPSATEDEISIRAGQVTLQGSLVLPKASPAVVLFAHGSGSSRHSPRNRYVAQVLQSHGMGTLLFDLLTREEESIDQITAELRFDIPSLATRLTGATRWTARDARDSPAATELASDKTNAFMLNSG